MVPLHCPPMKQLKKELQGFKGQSISLWCVWSCCGIFLINFCPHSWCSVMQMPPSPYWQSSSITWSAKCFTTSEAEGICSRLEASTQQLQVGLHWIFCFKIYTNASFDDIIIKIIVSLCRRPSWVSSLLSMVLQSLDMGPWSMSHKLTKSWYWNCCSFFWSPPKTSVTMSIELQSR